MLASCSKWTQDQRPESVSAVLTATRIVQIHPTDMTDSTESAGGTRVHGAASAAPYGHGDGATAMSRAAQSLCVLHMHKATCERLYGRPGATERHERGRVRPGRRAPEPNRHADQSRDRDAHASATAKLPESTRQADLVKPAGRARAQRSREARFAVQRVEARRVEARWYMSL